MKKITILLVIFVLFLTPVFAKGSSEESKKEITLSVLWFNDANESDAFLETMQDYLDENPNIKLDMQIVAFNEYENKLKLMISGGNPPDIARVTNNQVTSLLNALEPIDLYVSNINSIKDQFMKGSIAFAENLEGELVAYPTEATANGMLVNIDAYNNAGIDVKELSKTWNWDEWEDAANKVVEANDKIKYGLVLDYSPHRFSTLIFEMGGKMMNNDQSKVDFSNQGVYDAINLLKKYQDVGLVPSSVWLGSENPAELFQAGLVACHIGGSWNINTYSKNVKDFSWAAVNTPKGKIRSSVPGGKFIASFKNSKNKKEAMQLMATFSDEKHNSMYCSKTFNLSSRINSNVPYASNKDDFEVFSEDLVVTPAFTANEWKSPRLNKVYSYIREQIVQVLINNITAEEAATNINMEAAKF